MDQTGHLTGVEVEVSTTNGIVLIPLQRWGEHWPRFKALLISGLLDQIAVFDALFREPT